MRVETDRGVRGRCEHCGEWVRTNKLCHVSFGRGAREDGVELDRPGGAWSYDRGYLEQLDDLDCLNIDIAEDFVETDDGTIVRESSMNRLSRSNSVWFHTSDATEAIIVDVEFDDSDIEWCEDCRRDAMKTARSIRREVTGRDW